MVAGDRASIKALGEQLPVAAGGEAINDGKGKRPIKISHPFTVGPYKDVPDFALTFHLEGQGPLAEILPLRRRDLPPLVCVAVAVLAAVGAISIAPWIASHVFQPAGSSG